MDTVAVWRKPKTKVIEGLIAASIAYSKPNGIAMCRTFQQGCAMSSVSPKKIGLPLFKTVVNFSSAYT
jgi:hypothetical protein